MLASEGVKVCKRIYIASGNARQCHRALIQKGTKSGREQSKVYVWKMSEEGGQRST